MLSPEQMQNIWDLSDTIIYQEAVDFIQRMVKKEGMIHCHQVRYGAYSTSQEALTTHRSSSLSYINASAIGRHDKKISKYSIKNCKEIHRAEITAPTS